MLSAPPVIVRLPGLATSSVWLALLIVIAAAEAAVPENSSVVAANVLMLNAGPLVTVPVRLSVPPLPVVPAMI